MTTQVKVTMELAGEETIAAASAPGAADAAGRTLRADGYRVSKLLNASSTPTATAGPAIFAVTMSGSTQSLDLTAATLQGGRTQDMTGKKIVAWKIQADAANAGSVTVRAHATDGYDIFGNTTTGVVFTKGQKMMGAFTDVASQLAAIDATHKIIQLAGASGYIITLELYFS